MDLRPLGDGMSCVAVAMPQAALCSKGGDNEEGAPELRRVSAAVRGARQWWVDQGQG